MSYRHLCAAVLLALTGCSTGTDSATPAGADHAAIEAIVVSPRVRFAGQPAPAAFAGLAAEGTEVVVNLREADELDFDEARIAAEAGLQYYAVPISRSGPAFDPDAIREIGAIMARHRDDNVLVHCSSGNRVAAWYAINLVATEGLDPDTALARARQLGLTRPALEHRVREYLDATTGP